MCTRLTGLINQQQETTRSRSADTYDSQDRTHLDQNPPLTSPTYRSARYPGQGVVVIQFQDSTVYWPAQGQVRCIPAGYIQQGIIQRLARRLPCPFRTNQFSTRSIVEPSSSCTREHTQNQCFP